MRLAIEHAETRMNDRHAQPLRQVTFSDSRIAEHEHVLVPFHESPRREIEEQDTVDPIEAPVERVQRLAVAKARFFDAPVNETVTSSLYLVVDEQAEEIQGAQNVDACLLSAGGQGVRHAAQAELTECAIQFIGGHQSSPYLRVSKCVRYVAMASMSGCSSVSGSGLEAEAR